MDSSDIQCSSSSSISSNLGCEKAAMIKSRRTEFFANYQSQEFSFPDSIMFYVAKNPTSPKLYQKVVGTCKDFFVKNPILVISKLSYFDGEKWDIPVGNRNKCPSDLSKITSKLWITHELHINSDHENAVNKNILSSVMPKIYQCGAKSTSIDKQIISFHDLFLLISAAKRIRFNDVTVQNKDGSDVDVEKIVEVSVKAKWIQFESRTTLFNFTSKTMKELLKYPHFSKLNDFIMNRIPETFDIETFYAYMKKNKTTKFLLRFDDSISDTYKNRLEEIVNEILATETFEYKAPLIGFNGLNREKADKLDRIYWYH